MYKDLFGLESIETPSENEMKLQYSKPAPYTVSLVFNPTTKQLADAKVRIHGLGPSAFDILIDRFVAISSLDYPVSTSAKR